MPDFTLSIRRYDPVSGGAPYQQDFTVELPPQKSVLDAILEARNHQDGTIGIRCSCRQAICGSCAVRINGRPKLACNTQLQVAASEPGRADARITVEPIGNHPVLKDLIVDMDEVHWKKIRRVTPWLLPEGEAPEREYVVPHEAMVDVTQTMACIQCAACVSDCLSMEVDPLFIGPAALAKAYRFVGDPRDAQRFERLNDLSQDPHGIYDCTHCFNCIEACPKDVAPMSQIMRLRRIAGSDHEIVDRNNGHRHERAFVDNIRKNGLLKEADLLPDSYGGKLNPAAGAELMRSLPAIVTALLRGKVTPKAALVGHKLPDQKRIKDLITSIDAKDERRELNLYVAGEDEDEDEQPAPAPSGSPEAQSGGAA